jgi:hypothetical protein
VTIAGSLESSSSDESSNREGESEGYGWKSAGQVILKHSRFAINALRQSWLLRDKQYTKVSLWILEAVHGAVMSSEFALGCVKSETVISSAVLSVMTYKRNP